ncbi:MAG: histone deacetylase family protein [Candidatus Roizmanbacteria bacterium]|nr:histone deacetylase family protein [Candidatus Roizmanbacteria bacterium]
MYILSAGSQKDHNPQFEIFNGEQTSHSEVPARIDTIEKALRREKFQIDKTFSPVPKSLLLKTHKVDYVKFISQASRELKNNESLYPSIFNMGRGQGVTNSMTKMGNFSSDMYTPILPSTYKSAFESASIAYSAAQKLQQGKIQKGYTLCRPPGHHATSSLMGGYCYFNNTAIAANYLSSYGKVAVLDVDLHHGNGTQEIFYQRKDVLTVSIHADPRFKFPYYTGFVNETGEGLGKGFNVNYPLAEKTGDKKYQATLEKALLVIKKYRPTYLVVALGLDTFIEDPIGFFSLTTEYYQKMAETIAHLQVPILIVQEGGYNTEKLGNNAVSFIKGMIS